MAGRDTAFTESQAVAITWALVPGCPQLKVAFALVTVGVPDSPAARGLLESTIESAVRFASVLAFVLVSTNFMLVNVPAFATRTGTATSANLVETFVVLTFFGITTKLTSLASAVAAALPSFILT